MSNRLELSLLVGGAVAALFGVMAVVVAVRRPSPARATLFARRWKLPLTPEVADQVGLRLRTQMIAQTVAIGVIAGSVTALLPFLVARAGPSAFVFTGTVSGFAGLWLIVPIGAVIGLAVDAAITGRRAGPRVARLEPATLTDFMPPWLIRAVRATWLLPLVATLVWLSVPAGATSRTWPHHFSFAVIAVAVAAPIVGLLVEAWQRHIVRGPQRASSGLELAFDDAFRAATVLTLSLVGVWFASLATNLVVAAPLMAGRRSFGTFIAIAFTPIVIGLAIQITLATQSVRQRFRARLAPMPPAPVLPIAG